MERLPASSTVVRALRSATCFAFATLVLALPVACEQPGDETGVTAEVLEFGTFEFGTGLPGSREARFTSHSDIVTPRLGSRFGFRFRIDNAPAADSIELKTFVSHPPIKQRSGETTTRYALLTTIPLKNGTATSITGYSFDRPEEMTPGVWTFLHTFRGKTLVKQSFTVTASAAD